MKPIILLIILVLFLNPEWETYTSEECGFRAEFPNKVSRRTFSVELENPQYAFFSYRDLKSSTYYYSVHCTDLGEGASETDDIEQQLEEDILRGVSDKIDKVERIDFHGHSARHYTLTRDSLKTHRILFYAGRFSYDLSVTESVHETENVERFFDSFQLLE